MFLARVFRAECERGEPLHAVAALRARMATGLQRWIGDDGWQALVSRAQAESESGPTGPPEERELQALLTVCDVLARQIGEDLALRLIEQACQVPDVPPEGGPLG